MSGLSPIVFPGWRVFAAGAALLAVATLSQWGRGKAQAPTLAVSVPSWRSLLGPTGAPARMAVFYGWPAHINRARSIDQAAAQFSRYGVVFFGQGLELTSHPQHEATRQLVDRLTPTTTSVGYVALGAERLSLEQVRATIQSWQAVGVSAVLLDEAGFDFANSRARQNAAIIAAHRAGLRAIVNAHDPADLLDPQHGPVALRAGDGYFYEGLLVSGGHSERRAERHNKLGKLARWLPTGVAVFATSTTGQAAQFDRAAFACIAELAKRYRFAAFGWGEHHYAASGHLPWRAIDTASNCAL